MALGRELLLARELRLKLGQPAVLGFDRLALVPDLALALLELCLELGEFRVALVERGGAASQTLVGLHARLEDLLLLGEGRPQFLFACLSGGKLPAQVVRGAVRRDHRKRLCVSGSCGELEAQLDVGLRLGRLGRLRLLAPALELSAKAGAEFLLLVLGRFVLFGRHVVS